MDPEKDHQEFNDMAILFRAELDNAFPDYPPAIKENLSSDFKQWMKLDPPSSLFTRLFLERIENFGLYVPFNRDTQKERKEEDQKTKPKRPYKRRGPSPRRGILYSVLDNPTKAYMKLSDDLCFPLFRDGQFLTETQSMTRKIRLEEWRDRKTWERHTRGSWEIVTGAGKFIPIDEFFSGER